ncbi:MULTISPECIES: peptidase [Flavobacterium]|uniref:peptidase n=1 Tax=Flavobacterium TaxID=237 RepID=UPI001FCBD569|nr:MULTISPECIES: peptidase [Flavobacterium]UOK43151.1 peptidase [Flavobacterium enshiense]
MSGKRLKRQLIRKKLFSKNRLVILNEDTFAEIFSLRLTLMNVFIVATVGALLIIFVTTYIIAFTPLREYIPGYASTELKRQAIELAIKSDSLEKAMKRNNLYVESIKKVLNGDLEYAKLNIDSIIVAEEIDSETLVMEPSKSEMELRKEVESKNKKN